MHPLLEERPEAQRAYIELGSLIHEVVADIEEQTPSGWDSRLIDDNGREVSLLAEALRWVAGETAHKGKITPTNPLVRKYPAEIVKWRDREWAKTHLIRRRLRERLVRYTKDQGGFGGRPPKPSGPAEFPAEPVLLEVITSVSRGVERQHNLPPGELLSDAWSWLNERPELVEKIKLLSTSLFKDLENQILRAGEDVLDKAPLYYESVLGFDVDSTTGQAIELGETTEVRGLRDEWDGDDFPVTTNRK